MFYPASLGASVTRVLNYVYKNCNDRERCLQNNFSIIMHQLIFNKLVSVALLQASPSV